MVSFAVSCISLNLSFQKPFNPILGETFQGFFEEGTRVYCEHTSHHPPIANFLVVDPQESYEFFGFHEFKAKLSKNSLTMKNEGPNNIKFKDGQLITYQYPGNKVSGLIWGEKQVSIEGSMMFVDKEN